MGQAHLRSYLLPAVLLLARQQPAQEVLWQRTPTPAVPDLLGGVRTFGDVNGDGFGDVLAAVFVSYGLPGQHYEVQFWSGQNGSVLQSVAFSTSEHLTNFWPTGDVDGDGSTDFATVTQGWTATPEILTIHSRNPHRVIWTVTMQLGSQIYFYAGDGLDVDGDGRNEVLVISAEPNNRRLLVFEPDGRQRYVIPASQFGVPGFWLLSVAAVGDIDGDGGDDFVVGGAEPTGRGAVVLVSGRSGSVLRISYGQQSPDILGESTAAAGDVDDDGVPDYIAGSSTVNPRGLVVLFSGTTGIPIHTWNNGYGHSLVGRIDVDQDGILDVVTGSPGYYNAMNSYGRMQAFSGRDGQLLWEMHPGYGQTNMFWTMATIGAQPGSPYPVVVYNEPGFSGVGRVTAVHTRLAGAGAVVGSGCGMSGIPLIGVRRQGTGTRITMSNGAPGGLAWVMAGPAAQNTYGGYSLPLSLDQFGLTGCSLLVAPMSIGFRLLGTSGLDVGYAFADLPLSVSTTGQLFASQWLTIDPLTGAFALSPRHELRLQ